MRGVAIVAAVVVALGGAAVTAGRALAARASACAVTPPPGGVRAAAAQGLAPFRRAVSEFQREASASVGNVAALTAALNEFEAAGEGAVVAVAAPVACSEGEERLREALFGWVAAPVGLETCRHFVRTSSTEGGLAAYGNCIGRAGRAFAAAARDKLGAESAVAGGRCSRIPPAASDRLRRVASRRLAEVETAARNAALEEAVAAILLGGTPTLAAGHTLTVLRLAEVLDATDRQFARLRRPTAALSDDGRTAWAAEAQRSLELAQRMSAELSSIHAALKARHRSRARRTAGLADYYGERLAFSLRLHAPLRARIARAHAADEQATRPLAEADVARIETALADRRAEIAGSRVALAPRPGAALRDRSFGAYVGRTPLSVLTGGALEAAEQRAAAALAGLRLSLAAS